MERFGEKFGEALDSVKSAFKAEFKPLDFVREEVPFIERLELPKEVVEWIAEVRKTSRRAGAELPKDPKAVKGIVAFDLVRLHLLMERDLKDLGPTMLSRETERFLDRILDQIFAWYDKHPLVDERHAKKYGGDESSIKDLIFRAQKPEKQ